ncbi:MAG: carboxypeptidase regulatory-like domain-containing protein [bacterium]
MRRIFSIISLCLLTVTPLEAEERGVEIRGCGKELLETEPGRTITTVFQITNKSAEKQEFTSEVQLPEGWIPVTRDISFELGVNESDIRLVSFFIPQAALADKYEVTYLVKGGGYPSTISNFCTIYIVVLPVARLEVKLLEAPAHIIAGEDYRTSFVVTNECNIENTVSIKIDSGENLPFMVDTEKFTLAPGESKTIKVVVKTEVKMRERVKHFLALTAQVLNDQKIQARAISFVEIIPRIAEAEDWFHRLPVEVTLRQVTSKNEADRSGLRTQISGKGTLDEAGKKHIRFLFSGQDIDEYCLSYRTKDYEFHLGDYGYYLSPLTENNRYGRGITGKLNLSNFSLGASYLKTPEIKPEEKQMAGYIDYLIREKYRIGLNYLKEIGLANDEMVSLEAQLKLAKNTEVELEYALGKKDKEDDKAYWLKVSGGQDWISYYLKFIQAGPDYPGHYGHRDSFLAALTFPLKDNLRLNANFQQEKNKLDGEPLNRDYQLGLNYKSETSPSLSFNWRNRYRGDQLSNSNLDYQEESFEFSIEQRFKKLNLWASAESGKINKRNKGTSHLKRYIASAYFKPTNKQSYRGYLSYDNQGNFTGEKTPCLTAGLTISYQIADRTLFDLDLQTNDYQESYQGGRDIFEIRLSHTLPNGHKIPICGRYTSYKDSPMKDERALTIEYIIPFGLPVSKKDTGMVKGYVYDEETKEPLPDIIIRVNGMTVATDQKGNFVFPSLRPGNYYLHVERMGLNRISVQQTPIEVTVESGEKTWVEIGIVRTAALVGQVMVYGLENNYNHNSLGEKGGDKKADYYVIGEGNRTSLDDKATNLVEASGLANMVVELANGSEIKRRLTDRRGRFEFEELRPDKWTLKIYDNNLPEYHYLEKDTFEFELKPGQEEEILVKVLPKKRRIQIIEEGGTLR